MLFTVDEARALKPTLARIKDLEKEFGTYKGVVNAFSVWFFILTTVRSLVVATVIISMLHQEPNLSIAWNRGDGIGFLLVYLLVTCIPVIGNIAVIVAPVAVVIASFTTGNGIAGNFVPFILPIALAYAICFFLIYVSNALINAIIKTSCPKIYEEIKIFLGADEFTKLLHTTEIHARNSSYEARKEKASTTKRKSIEEDEDEEEFDD